MANEVAKAARNISESQRAISKVPYSTPLPKISTPLREAMYQLRAHKLKNSEITRDFLYGIKSRYGNVLDNPNYVADEINNFIEQYRDRLSALTPAQVAAYIDNVRKQAINHVASIKGMADNEIKQFELQMKQREDQAKGLEAKAVKYRDEWEKAQNEAQKEMEKAYQRLPKDTALMDASESSPRKDPVSGKTISYEDYMSQNKDKFLRYARDYLLRAGVPDAEPGYKERIENEEFLRDVDNAKKWMYANPTASISQFYRDMIAAGKEKGYGNPRAYADNIISEIGKTTPKIAAEGTGKSMDIDTPLFRFFEPEDLKNVSTMDRDAIEQGRTPWHDAARIAGQVARLKGEMPTREPGFPIGTTENQALATGAPEQESPTMFSRLADSFDWARQNLTIRPPGGTEEIYSPSAIPANPIGNTAPPIESVPMQNAASQAYQGMGDASIPAIPETPNYNTSDLSQYLQ
jgi:hypothetical protein